MDSRQRGSLRYRTYRLASGRRHYTVELPRAVLRHFSKKAVAKAVAAWERGEARRERRDEIETRIREGIKPLAIADELAVTESYVRLVRKQLGKEPK